MNNFFDRLRIFIYTQFKCYFRNCNPRNYAACGKHVQLFGPLNLDPSLVYLDDHVRLQPGIRMISHRGILRVGKYSAISADCTIVPGAHIPTVGIPQFLSMYHINDAEGCIVVEEDCWVGTGAYLLSHAHIRRGAIVAAGAVVTKDVPPYAVVAGSPAKIIASRFTIDQILAHESILYHPEERMIRSELEELFSEYYVGKKSLGISTISPDDQTLLAKARSEYKVPVFDTTDNSESVFAEEVF